MQTLEEINVKQGDTLPINAHHSTSQVMFGIGRKEISDYEARRTDAPFVDPFWYKQEEASAEQVQQIAQVMSASAGGARQALEAALPLAVGPSQIPRRGLDRAQ